MSFYIKPRGGDPRNHDWIEVTEYEYDSVNKESHFKKEVENAKQESKDKEERKEKT